MSRSQRHRVLTRAVALWRTGQPHKAWTVLHDAGMEAYWPTFQRTAFRKAREQYVRAISRYQ
jgi:hypothetical protein